MEILVQVGLCATCQHVKVIRNSRGTAFMMCELAKTDKRFAKYPSLPVLACSGYRTQSSQEDNLQAGRTDENEKTGGGSV